MSKTVLLIFFRKVKSFIWSFKFYLLCTFSILACYRPIQNVAKKVLRKFNWKPIFFRDLNDFSSQSLMLVAASSSTVAAPSFNGIIEPISVKKFSSLSAHIIQKKGGGIIATTYSPAVILDEKLLLSPHLIRDWIRIKTDSGNLFLSEKNFLIGRINATSEIEKGILIGGAGAFNWYHFVVEILPKAFLASHLPSRFDGVPFLVPEECLKYPSFTSALACFSGNRPIRFVQKSELVGLNFLVVFDEISIGPFNLVSGEWPQVKDYAHHDDFLRLFFEEFRTRILASNINTITSKNLERRVFLTRPGIRRNYNQDELFKIASKYNFEAFSAENFTLEEQAKIFSESSLVIGPSGAAWVGIVFREAPLCGLTWLPREYQNFCGYSGLANLLGHQLDFIEAQTSRPLKSTGEAYVYDYRVCPVQFESALKRMVGQNQ